MARNSKSKADNPEWINSSNDRKRPYKDDELEQLASDFIANMPDIQAWNRLIENVGEQKARQILKERLMARDGNNLVNWEIDGLAN